ncbi:autophagy-related protein 16-1 isoform X2 [Zootermopsis nevadensis]|uniref:autophagy-related protein 16-1 isoform X2 n=1 Tax=Zootermopsis nevadensis TaxID=136037 RepID=UPI000B8E52FF|nr:autophagy-related protein 16-1 isoform X2 [Zootermopsis nevadensis]
MAASDVKSDYSDWRKTIILRLQNRNRSQRICFQDLISFHNRLFDSSNALRGENLQLTVQNEKLRQENFELHNRSGSGNGKPNEKIQALEQKLLHQQEELTELHRRKGENAQQLIDLNQKLQEKEKQLQALAGSFADSVAVNTTLRAEIQMYQNNIKELENLNQMLKDEHQALQLAFASLEEKLRKAQDENRALVERLIRYKSKDAEKMNEENENFVRDGAFNPTAFLIQTLGLFGKKQAKLQKELEEAAKDTRALSPDRLRETGAAGAFFASSVPSRVLVKFDAHDGDVNAVKWSPVDRILATGGADRRVKLWDLSKVGQFESKGMLVGSNAGVMSVDFDSTGALILGASSDFASRVWTIADQRLRHTLTGHSGKVMAAKFLGEPSKVVSGSHDRTLKIWDLRSKACIETKFAGSSCNDLVTTDSAGTTIISGHFDKRIRFWDTRSDTTSRDILLQGKVTSLDLSRDAIFLLGCVRDDTIKVLDLRMNQIICSFSAEGFKVGCDWSRAAFSPDGQYIAVGSADGSVFIWNVSANKLESVLKEHLSPVTAVAWDPYNSFLASVDKSKKTIVWGEG